MLRRVLCVDDEPNVLAAFERQLRKGLDVQTALGPERGLQAIAEDGPFAVVVSDLRMPVMDGVEFLSRVRTLAPDTVRIMLTGQAELANAIAAVNRGSVFQFLTKPCPAEVLLNVLEAALEQHRLITSERELLEQTLRRSIAVLTEILGLANPLAFSRAQHIRHYVQYIAARLELSDSWQFELAAMLSQIGYVAIPPEILEKLRGGEPLVGEEAAIVGSQTRIAHELLAQIPRLELITQMVARQDEPWHERNRDRAAVGAHLLQVARDFDDAMVRGGEVESVVYEMLKRGRHNPEFVKALTQVEVAQDGTQTRTVNVSQLRTGMIINADVLSKSGLLLLAKGQEVTPSAIFRLTNFATTVGVMEPIHVMVPANKGKDVTMPAPPMNAPGPHRPSSPAG